MLIERGYVPTREAIATAPSTNPPPRTSSPALTLTPTCPRAHSHAVLIAAMQSLVAQTFLTHDEATNACHAFARAQGFALAIATNKPIAANPCYIALVEPVGAADTAK
ncbi:hypothetical protein CDD80_5083 [Ophiocordyceps camponoti-rufipedis]|uniref:Uncharacterized protein n=1 Tax=Ophiocordyceps camponoti-rufipedis TaxID=2004952 RepID=A0A2C5Y0L6_9HYPO|nr:hypothetical protein CDD80_5083 [Ophiocordyceps camponoti-rufipedis]